MSVLDLARGLSRAGMSCIPIVLDGSKRPACRSWKRYQDRVPTPAELLSLFDGTVGIGLVAGRVSGGLEILDFETTEAFEGWAEVLGQPVLLDRLPIHETPGKHGTPGRHVLFRSGSPEGNQKLAEVLTEDVGAGDETPGKKPPAYRVLIETRGEGGYVVAPGSPLAVHASGRAYSQIAGPPATETPTITSEERDLLLAAARSLNERPARIHTEPKSAARRGRAGNGLRPGDDFNTRASWREILEPHGWTAMRDDADGRTLWRRPGKDGPGHSATTGYCRTGAGGDLLYVFSTDAAPFEAETAYSKFAAHALLNRGGDYSAAARALAETGYGDGPEATPNSESFSTDDNGEGAPKDDDEAEQKTQVEQLLEYCDEAGIELWRTRRDEFFATVPIDEHVESWPLESTATEDWLTRAYYTRHKRPPATQARRDAIATLRARARFEGDQHEAPIRVAGTDSEIHIDRGDSEWRSIVIRPGGWSSQPRHNVRFRRASGLLALPEPARGGSLGPLRRLLNLEEGGPGDNTDDNDKRIPSLWVLFLVWVLAAMRPRGPFPVLGIHGEQGAGKSTVAHVARRLTDPSGVPLRAQLRELRDLAIAANNSWVLGFDNLSELSHEFSDALCRLSTGGGFTVRRLHRDAEETLFEASRPVLFTGINDLATRGDLLDRMIHLNLPVIPEERRMTERAFWAAFDDAEPAILGALYDLLARALTILPTVQLQRRSRMADFFEFGVAVERAAAWPPGTFLAAYERNRDDAAQIALDEDPLATAIGRLLESRHGPWIGTALDLFKALKALPDDSDGLHGVWPKDHRAVGKRLVRLAPNLRRVGIDVRRDRSSRERTITITRIPLSQLSLLSPDAGQGGLIGPCNDPSPQLSDNNDKSDKRIPHSQANEDVPEAN